MSSFPDFKIATRYMDQSAGGKQVFIIISESMGRELGPFFYNRETANEIAFRVNCREDFFRNIPHVPAGTPVPRPAGADIRGDYPDAPSQHKRTR